MVQAIQQIASSLFAPASQDSAGGAITQVWSWLTSESVLPYFAISIAISLVFVAILTIKKTVWGA